MLRISLVAADADVCSRKPRSSVFRTISQEARSDPAASCSDWYALRRFLALPWREVLPKTPTSVAELQKLLKAAIENNRTLATHAERMSTELAAHRKEMGELRGEIRKTTADRDKLFNQVVQLTDQMHQLQTLVKGLKERNAQLAEQLAKVKNAANKDIDELNLVDGVVTAVNDKGLLEISIGSDDGVRVGSKLDVFGKATYVGRAEVLVTDPDRAVAKAIAEFVKSKPQKGDRVVTRLEPESAQSAPTKMPAEESPK